MGRGRYSFILLMTFCFYFVVIPVANAYIDPGTGSALFQAAIAGVLAAGVTFKLFWHRIKGFFTKSKKRRDESP